MGGDLTYGRLGGGRAKLRSGFIAVGAALFLGIAPGAMAADTFVNQATGDDVGTNPCTSAAQPCATVQAGIDRASAGATVRVAPGNYGVPGPVNPITLGNGKSLRATGSATATRLSTTYVAASGAGTIEGFTFVGDSSVDSTAAFRFMGTGTMQNNIFDADDAVSQALRIELGAGNPVVSHNAFTDDGIGQMTAIDVSNSSPTISDNTISGYFAGIDLRVGSATVSGNTLEALHNFPLGGLGHAISVNSSGAGNTSPTIANNVIRDPVDDEDGDLNPFPVGVRIGSDGNPAVPTTGATLRRNNIRGYNPGVFVAASDGPVTLDSDLIVGAPEGISAFENAPAPPASTLGDLSARNITVVGGGGNGAIVLQEVHLTLDASIVSNSINDSSGTQATCTITDSRGLTGTNPIASTNGCDNFSTPVDPQFVDPSPTDPPAGNFHLQSTSPMIDFVPQSSPAPGPLDFDGDPREVAGHCGGPVLRDAGADEFVPDCAPAETQIDSGPAEGSLTNSRSASFGFSSEPGATFACSVDGGAFGACTSPRDVNGLADGQHTFAVRASDAVGNTDPSPATRTWRVDGTAPETQFDSGPADGATINTRSATYGFSASEDGASFECSLDGALFTACAAPLTINGLQDGAHALEVRATDPAGNADASPARRTLTVDSSEAEDHRAPQTEIDKVKVKNHKVKVRFSADETLSKFACRLDKGQFKPCVSPKTYRGVDDGKHKVLVKATDPAGNTDRTAAKARFEVG
jgi:hypothetical protein